MKRENVGLARGLRHRMTDAERVLWRHLRGRHFERWKFRRQHQISGYIVDFVCLAAGLVIELDGGQHLQNAKKDATRTRALNALGYRVIRFWNDDVLTRTNAVLEEILTALKQAPPHPGPLLGSTIHGLAKQPGLGLSWPRRSPARDAIQRISRQIPAHPRGEREKSTMSREVA